MSAAVLTGCAGDVSGGTATWEEASASGFAQSHVAAVYLSRNIDDLGDSDSGGAVAFIESDGDVRVLATGKLDNGPIAANAAGAVTWASETTSYEVGGKTPRRHVRAGVQATGHWAGARADGTFVQVFNTGATDDGYATDVYWTRDGESALAVVPDVPDSVGIAGQTVYVSSAQRTPTDDENRLYRVDPDSEGRLSPVHTWRPAGAEQGVMSCGTSDFFEDDGRLWFFDSLCRVDQYGDPVPEPDGTQSRLQLASLDPVTGTYAAKELRRYDVDDYITNDSGGWTPVAQAAVAGHLVDRTLYTVDADGVILAADTRTGRLREAGRVSEVALEASDVQIAWHESTLVVLALTDGGKVALEHYDVTAGKRESIVRVRGLEEFLDENQDVYPYSMTALPRG